MKNKFIPLVALSLLSQFYAFAFPDNGWSVSSFPRHFHVNPANQDESHRNLNLDTIGTIGNWSFSKTGNLINFEWGQLSRGSLILNIDSDSAAELRLSITARYDTIISTDFTFGFSIGSLGNQAGDGVFGYRVNGVETIVSTLVDINTTASQRITINVRQGDILEIFARSTGGRASLGWSNVFAREVDTDISTKSLSISKAYANASGTAYNVKIPSALRNNQYTLESSTDLVDWNRIDSIYIIQLENEDLGFTFTTPQAQSGNMFYRIKLDNPIAN